MKTVFIIIDQSGPSDEFEGAFPTRDEAFDEAIRLAAAHPNRAAYLRVFELSAGQHWHSIPEDADGQGGSAIELKDARLPA